MKAIIRKDSYGQWTFVVPMPKGAIPLRGVGWSQANALEMVHGLIKAKWAKPVCPGDLPPEAVRALEQLRAELS